MDTGEFEIVSKKAKLEEISFENDSKNSDFDELDGSNPFLIDPVLTILFSQMSVSDLKNSRHVCSLWEMKSVQRLEEMGFQGQRSLKPIEINKNFDLERFHRDVKNTQIFSSFTLRFQVYLDTILKNPHVNILTNFKISRLFLNLNGVRIVGWGEVQNILKPICKTVKSLHIINHYYGLEYPNGTEFKCQFPALQEFIFESVNRGNHQTSQDFVDLICQILKNAPSLKTLLMIGLPKHSHFFWEIMNSMDFIHNTDLLLGICAHDLTGTGIPNLTNDYFDSDLEQFSNLKLKKLTIKGILGVFSPLLYFLDKYGQDLEICQLDICLRQNEPNLARNLVLPHLPNLKSLNIETYSQRQGDENNFTPYSTMIEPFNLAQKFPKLRELSVINFDSFENIILEGSANLKVLGSVQITEEKWLTNLSYTSIMYLFPNLCQIKFLDNKKRGIQIPHFLKAKLVKIRIDSIEELQKFQFTRLQGVYVLKILFSIPEADVENLQVKIDELKAALVPIENYLQNLRIVKITFRQRDQNQVLFEEQILIHYKE